MPNASYDVTDGGVLTVDWSFPAPTNTYEYTTGANIPGAAGSVSEEGTVSVGIGDDATQTVTLDLAEIGIGPGDTEEVAVTTTLVVLGTGSLFDQIQDTVEVTRPIDTGEILIDCAGISPEAPNPEDVINVSVDYNYTGDLSQPTVTFEAVLDGDTVSQIYTEENTVGGDGTITLTPILDSGHQPGDEIDISVEATDISPTGSF